MVFTVKTTTDSFNSPYSCFKAPWSWRLLHRYDLSNGAIFNDLERLRFPGHAIFDAEYLRNGTIYIHSFNGILIGTYTRHTQQRRFDWPWVALSDLAKSSMTRSVERSLCDSWASCYIIIPCPSSWQHRFKIRAIKTVLFLHGRQLKCWFSQLNEKQLVCLRFCHFCVCNFFVSLFLCCSFGC